MLSPESRRDGLDNELQYDDFKGKRRGKTSVSWINFFSSVTVSRADPDSLRQWVTSYHIRHKRWHTQEHKNFCIWESQLYQPSKGDNYVRSRWWQWSVTWLHQSARCFFGLQLLFSRHRYWCCRWFSQISWCQTHKTAECSCATVRYLLIEGIWN